MKRKNRQVLHFLFWNFFPHSDMMNFCLKCIDFVCDKSKMKLAECKQIQEQKTIAKKLEYNKKRDMLDLNDWTKNQVGIYYKTNQRIIKRGAKLPIPDCLGTLVSPKIILTDASCVVQGTRL